MIKRGGLTFRWDIDGLWKLKPAPCALCKRSTHRMSIGFGEHLDYDCGEEKWRAYFRELAMGKTDEHRFPGEVRFP